MTYAKVQTYYARYQTRESSSRYIGKSKKSIIHPRESFYLLTIVKFSLIEGDHSTPFWCRERPSLYKRVERPPPTLPTIELFEGGGVLLSHYRICQANCWLKLWLIVIYSGRRCGFFGVYTRANFAIPLFQGGCFVWYLWKNDPIASLPESFQMKFRNFVLVTITFS